MRFDKIAFVLKRIVPLEQQGNIGTIYRFVMFLIIDVSIVRFTEQ